MGVGTRSRMFCRMSSMGCSVANTMSQRGGSLHISCYFFVTCIDFSIAYNTLPEIIYGPATSFDFLCRSSSGQLYKI